MPLKHTPTRLSLTLYDGHQHIQPCRPPSHAPPAPLGDPEPELDLVIQHVDDIEAELAKCKCHHNELWAKYSSQREPQPQTPPTPTEPPSTKASTPVIDGHRNSDDVSAKGFELSNADCPKSMQTDLVAANYNESADRREDAKRALLQRTHNVMGVDEE
ncbi:hypothetical protein DL96DRAFT_1276018 [Flagelloscypha sp. PMI_526]|nr:hypothetical protein DL96DRAFT_1276018 [Flagelloscypha sp. PMI_526]